ncbi:Na/Pi symporter [Corynebacterium gottingense]|uniref:Na/Pi cotransporter family protein n=1 Tax=Corynebacterium gottingense TaxID=2041036 RepID=A0ABX9UJ43_9CORY|nr:Na/Pi symporter [Corynebacterium gottingense]RMD19089.1 Na/Pi cotransporter family protein [Corynebacterium gottingense]WJZ14018.1 Na+/Pi-cotransporter [Corynebacterium gottingense]WJZ16333.1 Na+/Pi-cotransporter [Corynebacterium gottingense]
MSRDAKHAETGARDVAHGSTAVATKTKPAPDTDAPKNADDEPTADPLGWLPLSGTAKKVAEWISVVLAIWLLLNAVGMIGAGFKMAAGDQAKELFSFAENPFVGLAVGILATAIMQSSSTTTSITVGMIAGGLPLEVAVPMLFGANIGTTVTSTLVALGLSGNKQQFHRAFSMATVHDFYNLLALAIFFPLEIFTGFLSKVSGVFAGSLAGEGDGVLAGIFEAIGNGVDAITKPLVNLAKLIVSPLGDVWGGIVLSVGGVALILVVIGYIGKMLSALLVGRAQEMLHAALGRGPITGIFSGALITTAVQSSSTTTSLTVPLAASGKFKVKDLFPFVVGANIGTTITGLIAAFSASGVEAEAAMQGALVHTMFNVFSALVIMSLPFLRAIPPKGADWLATMADKNKWYVFLWVGGVFFALPLLAVLITNVFF